MWQDHRNPSVDIYGARLDSSNGALVDVAGISLCNNASAQYYPSVAFAGTAYQVVWDDYRGAGLYGQRVNPTTGALLDGAAGAAIAGPGTIPFHVYEPRVFPAGTAHYVAWLDYQAEAGPGNLVGSRLSVTPSVLDAPGVALATSANGQTQVAVAADAANYLVVWLDDRGGTRAIYAARVNGATGASRIWILLSSGGYLEGDPAVAFNGTAYLVTWRDYRSPQGIWGHAGEHCRCGALTRPADAACTRTSAACWTGPMSPRTARAGSWPGRWAGQPRHLRRARQRRRRSDRRRGDRDLDGERRRGRSARRFRRRILPRGLDRLPQRHQL